MGAPLLSLLQIVQTACDELGLVRPSVVATSTDLQARQLFALTNRELSELQRDKAWTVLQTEYDLHVGQPVTTTGNTAQGSYQITGIPSTAGISAYTFVCNAQNIPVAARVTGVDSATSVSLSEPATGNGTGVSCVFAQDTYSEPSDFDRFINQTWWDRTNRWALLGPDSPQVDQWHRSGVVTIGPRRHFRQIGPLASMIGGDFNSDFGTDFSSPSSISNYRLWPPPGALDTPIDLVFEYISNVVVVDPATRTGKTAFSADTDISILDAQALIMGVKWRFFQIKGFDYQALQQEAIDYVERLYANDGGAKTLSLSPLRASLLLSSGQVPDGNWPGNSS